MDSYFVDYATNIIGETNYGLSGTEIARYCSEFAIKYNVPIPYGSYPFPKTLANKRTALRENVNKFSGEQQFEIILSLCNLNKFEQNESVKEVKVRLLKNYGSTYGFNKIVDAEVIAETYHWLKDYPKAFEKYNDGLTKFEANLFERNAIDDMRLSLELVVKSLLGNEKSLENQLPEIGARLKEQGISSEIRNMYVKVLEYYTKYQNAYIKHDDRVNKNEMEYIIEITSLMMKFLIKTLRAK
ncbi:hypothetical protein [Ureibacillus endophyticus]|uniref:HEPN domain-containing protein n=1 Tax=Ureibacillus endophyticus TaxID=1978490 RepID=A0A494YTC4_9BACL|nr:hypothetical protein [Lysinibacillus endophyticus]RKQ13338.1 hypothetical protein D8M03_16290 [Lysinibacillus endophyticus]